MREGIAALVSGEENMEPIGEASNGQEALEKYRMHRPDITLIDIQMPLMSGVETIIGIRGEFPNARIIVLSTYAGAPPRSSSRIIKRPAAGVTPSPRKKLS